MFAKELRHVLTVLTFSDSKIRALISSEGSAVQLVKKFMMPSHVSICDHVCAAFPPGLPRSGGVPPRSGGSPALQAFFLWN